MSRYDPLRQNLLSRPGPVAVLTYDQIEHLIGRRLPPTAYGDAWRQWWANTETHSQALAWLRAGWRVTRPDRDNKEIEFRRIDDAPAPNNPARAGEAPPDGILVPNERLTPGALRLIEDAAEDSDGDLGRAVATLLNRAAMARRRQLLDWFAENTAANGTNSVKLIREDRDER